MVNPLQEIAKNRNSSIEISDDLEHYNKFLIESLNSKVGLINKILKYVTKLKGKQFASLC